MQSQTNFRKTLDFSGHNFYNGIDVHKKQWTVTTRVDGTYLKTNERIGYVVLDVDTRLSADAVALLQAVPESIKVRVVY